MRVDWSSGWLLERMMELTPLPESWANQPIGFGLDDPEFDPWMHGAVEPPAGWQNLPFNEGGE